MATESILHQQGQVLGPEGSMGGWSSCLAVLTCSAHLGRPSVSIPCRLSLSLARSAPRAFVFSSYWLIAETHFCP